jgi:transcriptional regulator with GAF, ATPase, and Fis domain
MINESKCDQRSPDRAPAGKPAGRFESLSWQNWSLLLIVVFITTVGLATALPPLLNDRVNTLWPWPKTALILLVTYSALILVFVAFLTYQQRRIFTLHRRAQEEIRERSRRNSSRLCALLNVSRIMGDETELQGVFDGITRTCIETFDCEQASLMLYDKFADTLEVRSAFGHSQPSKVLGRRRAIGEGIAGWVAKNRRPLLLGRAPDENCPPGLQLASPEISSAMVVPIIVRDELVGVINVSARSSATRFEEEDLRALEVFASNAGTCVRHTEHVLWMRQVMLNTDPKPTKKPPQIEPIRP